MGTPDDNTVARPTAHYPAAEINPTQFEEYVTDLLQSTIGLVENLVVTLQDNICGVDGSYVFDATVRFELGGMQFLVLVEAKLHRNPIKRELVQVLHDKQRSVGTHKSVLISTAPFQNGALTYAKAHGVALATFTEGRFVYETRYMSSPIERDPQLTRSQARKRGIPDFVGHAYLPGREDPRGTLVWVLGAEYPDVVAEALLGVGRE